MTYPASRDRPRPEGDAPPADGKPTPWRVEGGRPSESDAKRKPPMWPPPGGRRFWVFVLILFAINVWVSTQVPDEAARLTVPYVLPRAGRGGQRGRGHLARRHDPGRVPQARSLRAGEGRERAVQALRDPAAVLRRRRAVRAPPARGRGGQRPPARGGRGLLATIIFGFGPTLLLVALFIWLMRRAATNLGGGLGAGLGRSRAKRYEASEQRTTFADVAGIEEAEEELVEIVDFLKNPDRYRRLGGAIPKGVLLSGPPGTGKTLLARAVAGEADVPFFSLSASEFIEMVVGVGASRVRDLFNQAKETAPAIIFIDELDAIGRARGGGAAFGGHDEREQTLNQILTEMDGFTGSEGVIVLASTNRPEILDAALLRPGRFDRRVTVNPPDKEGRRKILDVHTRNVPLAPNLHLDAIAAATPGMVGADLRNLVNEAALTAARRNHECGAGGLHRLAGAHRARGRAEDHDLGGRARAHGLPRVGPCRARHAPARRRSRAQGVHRAPRARPGRDLPEPQRGPLRLRRRVPEGADHRRPGRAGAEELVYDDVTTGAESDLEQVTRIARQMVGRWGMSGASGSSPCCPVPRTSHPLPGTGSGPSEAARELVDLEVRRIVEECYRAALGLLEANRERLESLAQTLLEHETLDEQDAYRAAGFPDAPPRKVELEEEADTRLVPESRAPSEAAGASRRDRPAEG